MALGVAILLGLALSMASLLYGGLYQPALVLPSLLLLTVAAGILAGGALSGRFTLRFGGAQILLILLGGYLVLRAFAWNSYAGGQMLGNVGALGIVYLGGMWLSQSAGARTAFFALLIATGFVQIAVGVVQLSSEVPFWPLPWLSEQMRLDYAERWVRRFHGFYLNANHLAWWLNGCGLFALALAIWGRFHLLWKGLMLLGSLLLFWGSFQTLSRGGIVSLAVGLLALLAASAWIVIFRSGRLRIPLILLGIGLTVGLFFLFRIGYEQVPRYTVRFETALNEGDYREDIWATAWREFQTEPIWGTGPTTFKYYGRMYRSDLYGTDPTFAHNDWLQFLAESGAAGLFLLAVALAAHLVQFARSVRCQPKTFELEDNHLLNSELAAAMGAFACVAAYVTHSFFDFNFHLPANAFLAILCLGWIAGSKSSSFVTAEKPPLIPRLAYAAILSCLLAFIIWGPLKNGLFEIRRLQAENALRFNSVVESKVLASQLVRLQPQSATAWSLYGQALNLEGNHFILPEARRSSFRSAANAFRRAAEMEPLDSTHYLNQCNALLHLGIFNAPSQLAIRGIQYNPLQSPPYQFAGLSAAQSNDLVLASAFYRLSTRFPRAGQFPWQQLRALDK